MFSLTNVISMQYLHFAGFIGDLDIKQKDNFTFLHLLSL
jgi:hypothetical protein